MRRRLLALLPLASLLVSGCSSSGSKTSSTAAQPAPSAAASSQQAPAQAAPMSMQAAPGATGAAAVPGAAAPAGPPQGDYREIIKLNAAKLSEAFILDKIKRDGLVYNLKADEIIELRNGGVSERLIEALLATSQPPGAAPAGAAAAGATAAVAAQGAAAPVNASAPSLPATSGVFEGLVRREGGVVLFKSRWNVGTLQVVDGTVRWVDAKDASRNLFIPERSMSEQFLTCLKKAGGNECFEWGFRTINGDEYVFRDVSWEQGVNDKVLAIHDLTKRRYPNLIDSMRPVDKK